MWKNTCVFTRTSWLNHSISLISRQIRDTSHLFATRLSQIHEYAKVHFYSCVWHDSMCVTWLNVCDMTRLFAIRLSQIHKCGKVHFYSCVWHDSMCVTWLNVCDMTQCVWHDSIIPSRRHRGKCVGLDTCHTIKDESCQFLCVTQLRTSRVISYASHN